MRWRSGRRVEQRRKTEWETRGVGYGRPLGGAAGTEERVTAERDEGAERRVDALEKRAEVVVLAEDGVEAALHLVRLAAREMLGPRGDAPAEHGLALEDGDGDAALGEHGR